MSDGEARRRAATSEDDAYGGALGAFPYAARASDSWTFRAYVVVAALVAVGTILLFVLGLVGIVASTTNQSPVVTLVRAFVLVVMLSVLLPTVAPVLLVARRHRLGLAVDPRYDRALASAGFLFLGALYVGLLVSVPPAMQTATSGPLEPLIAALYDLPQLAGFGPPVLAAAVIWLLHRRFRVARGT